MREYAQKFLGEATKDDKGKPALSLLPRSAVEEIAAVLEMGAQKYGRDNWKEGMHWTRLIDAALRHIYAFADKEDIDPESGITHLAHAATNLMFLLEYYKKQKGEDDR